MITIENYKVVGWEHAIMGMRNPKNSWHLSDSDFYGTAVTHVLDENGKPKEQFVQYDALNIGPNDHKLAMQLVKGGPVHAKFRRMIVVYVDITAPLYWWKEFDTYKVGTVANSCSTMHKIADKEFELDDFSHEKLFDDDDLDGMFYSQIAEEELTSTDVLKIVIEALNDYRKRYIRLKHSADYEGNKDGKLQFMKEYWYQLIQLLPSSYRQKRTIMFNYETLSSIYKWRRNHKLDEDHWDVICDWIEELPYSEFITGKTGNTEVYEYNITFPNCPECETSFGQTGFVEVDEMDSNDKIKLAILKDIGELRYSKHDVDKPCASCAIDFGEE